MGNDYSKPTRKDSNELSLILQGLKGWNRGKVERCTEYGNQQMWVKSTQQAIAERVEDLGGDFEPL